MNCSYVSATFEPPFHLFGLRNRSADFDINGRSSAIMRGNENNDHRTGPAAEEPPTLFSELVFDNSGNLVGIEFKPDAACRSRQAFDAKGQIGGCIIFNVETAIDVGRGLSFIAGIDNLLDRRYYSAGRLDAPLFALHPRRHRTEQLELQPKDWKQTGFVAPGAPRAGWAGLDYRY